MGKGSIFKAEWHEFRDAQTGVSVRQLTDYKGHSHHLYFTNSGWYADGEGDKLLFGSDRCNETNLFSINLENGAITQLTEFTDNECSFLYSSLNPCHPEVYFWRGPTLIALDLNTLYERSLYRVSEGYSVNLTSVSADGRYVYTGIYEDLSARFHVDLLHGYIGFADYWQAMPHSQILQISTESGESRVVFEENYWIGHVNASTTQAHLLTFCHEGPWDKVDQRIWGLDARDGRVWKVRPQSAGEKIGHEYWFVDGEYIGYHGRTVEDQGFYGRIRFDNTDQIEIPLLSNSMHFHSNDLRSIIGDGSRDDPHLLLWHLSGERFEGPRTVLTHGGSFQIQQIHVHPRFSPDGKYILFTSDPLGYANLYLATAPSFDTLT